jgi:hypothetical protein
MDRPRVGLVPFLSRGMHFVVVSVVLCGHRISLPLRIILVVVAFGDPW